MEKVRLPRKRKKWLKKFGGFEYYIQVPPKNVDKAAIEDFEEIMKEFGKDWIEPKYFNNGTLVEVAGKDKNGVTWVAIMPTEQLHNAIIKEANKTKIGGK